jgi:hypothetical protein
MAQMALQLAMRKGPGLMPLGLCRILWITAGRVRDLTAIEGGDELALNPVASYLLWMLKDDVDM